LSLYVFLIASVYFTFSTIAMSLLLSHDLHVRLIRVVQLILNTQYTGGKKNGRSDVLQPALN